MRKKPLDMIPFVDIMIVVLFIFASIEEDSGGDAAKAATLEADNAKLRADLASAQASKTAAELTRDQLSGAVSASRVEVDRGVEAERKKQVMDALLGEAQVIEIEIAGEPTGEDIKNPCCFRRFGPDSKWKSCGEVPTGPDELSRWLDDGAGGLLGELNGTGSTPAVVVVRQERDAAYNLNDKLGTQIRSRTPIKKTYSITVDTPVEQCRSETK